MAKIDFVVTAAGIGADHGPCKLSQVTPCENNPAYGWTPEKCLDEYARVYTAAGKDGVKGITITGSKGIADTEQMPDFEYERKKGQYKITKK